MHTPCLVLKTLLRNGYHKIARVVFVRRVACNPFVTRGTWWLRVKRHVQNQRVVPKEGFLVIFLFFRISLHKTIENKRVS